MGRRRQMVIKTESGSIPLESNKQRARLMTKLDKQLDAEEAFYEAMVVAAAAIINAESIEDARIGFWRLLVEASHFFDNPEKQAMIVPQEMSGDPFVADLERTFNREALFFRDRYYNLVEIANIGYLTTDRDKMAQVILALACEIIAYKEA